MKKFGVSSIGDAIVDCIINVDDKDLRALELEKGTWKRVETDIQKKLRKALESKDVTLTSGGSIANSLIAYSQLGGDAAFFCCIGDDECGSLFHEELREMGVHCVARQKTSEATGTSLILITPDGERTMQTCLGVAGNLSAADIDTRIIEESDYFFVEGFLLSDPPGMQEALQTALQVVKRQECKAAVAFSELKIIKSYRSQLDQILNDAEIVFANADEACCYTGASNPIGAFNILRSRFPFVAVTIGEQGAYVSSPSEALHVTGYPCVPKDLTGAGDMFAGAFLYGISKGYTLEEAARGSCYLSMKVVSTLGARLSADTREFWDESVRGGAMGYQGCRKL